MHDNPFQLLVHTLHPDLTGLEAVHFLLYWTLISGMETVWVWSSSHSVSAQSFNLELYTKFGYKMDELSWKKQNYIVSC